MKQQRATGPERAVDSETLPMEKARVLYSHLPSSLIMSALLALILVIIQAPVIASGVRYGWLALMFGVLLIRSGLLMAWRRKADTLSPADAQRWLQRFRVGLFVTGIVWGVGGIVLLPSENVHHQLYVAFTLAGVSAGSATILAIDLFSVVGFIFPVLLSQILPLATSDSTLSQSMGLMITLFLLFLLASARETGRRLEDNFHLRVKAAQNEERLLKMLESSPIATRIADLESSSVVFANSCYNDLIEVPADKIIGVHSSSYYADTDEYTEIMKTIARGEKVVDKLIEIRSPGSSQWVKWVLASYFPIVYKDKPAVLGWFYDITERKLMEDEVEHEAFYDALTGLPNRLHFHNQLHKAVAYAQHTHSDVALMFIDLDHFKPVNDQHGHDIGDLLLKAVAQRILECLRQSDIAARLGGDEFVILLPGVGSDNSTLVIGEKIRHALDMPFDIEGLSLKISSSIGVAVYPKDTDKEEGLVKRADIAMYTAKAQGRNCVVAYQPGMQGEGMQFCQIAKPS
jgi:diguanylate cyclase (GGDEF)-like protein/PAS domain S-box-containing protein